MRLAPMTLALAAAATLGACTWVHLSPAARNVQVAATAPASCQKLGEVEVSVKHSLAFIQRNPRKVRDELETLARNEAPGLQANTIHPLNEPTAGQQRWAAWRCGN